MNNNAILLGAGASYELGMPLVWELTAELKKWLTPEKFIELNHHWTKSNAGHIDENVKLTCELLKRKDFHYENIIGALEVEIKRLNGTPRYQDLYGIKIWLLELIYILLYNRQIKNNEYIKKRLKFYSGIKELATASKPLWVFSLNHDLLLEIISAENNIPIKSGFNSKHEFKLYHGDILKNVLFDYLSRDDINKNNYNFFQQNEYGINLIKLHGSLDIFGKDDELNYLKLCSRENNLYSITESLRELNEDVSYILNNFKATNEIICLDENKKIQFLRRSLLSGAYKFNKKSNSQIAPYEFLELFKSKVNYSSTIYAIGYGFADTHINIIIRDWLSVSKDRQLIIIDPFPKIINELIHLSRQITIKEQSITDFLIEISDEKNKKKLMKENRKYKFYRKLSHNESLKNVLRWLLKKLSFQDQHPC